MPMSSGLAARRYFSEVVAKPYIGFRGKAQAEEKAQSARVLWRMSVHFEEACDELSRAVCNPPKYPGGLIGDKMGI